MNIKPKSQRGKLALILTLIVLIALIGIGSYYVIQRQRDTNNFNNPQSDNLVEDKTQPLADGNSDKTISEGKALLPTVPADSDNGSESGERPEKPKITRAEQTSNGSIRVSAIFTAPSSGTCKLTLSMGSHLIEKSAPVVVGPSYYTCHGFLVASTDIPESGEWTATITHQSNNKSNVSDTASIRINL